MSFSILITNFHIPNAPNTTIHPIQYGINFSFILAFPSVAETINCIPKITPTRTAITIPNF